MPSTDEILKTLNPKRNYKKLFILYGSLICAICVIIALITWWKNQEPKYIYITKEATQGNIATTISANGTLSPTHEVSIGSVISGIVLEVLVDVNDKVTKGQVLAKIDSESIAQSLYRYEAQLQSAKAQLQSAKVNLEEKAWQYEQYRNLHKKTQGKIPSQLELQTAKTTYNSALSEVAIRKASIKEIETSIRSTQVDLKNALITSPIDGVVLSRSIEVGQSVAASFQAPEFFIIAENLEEMELNVSISEADIGKVEVGQKVNFSVDSYPSEIFNAVVNRVNYGATQNETTTNNVVSYEARIYVDNKKLLLKPGMSATADITTKSVENAFLIPSSALYFNPIQPKTQAKKSSFNLFSGNMRPPRMPRVKGNAQTNTQESGNIWILENNTPKKIAVTIGISDGELTEIINPQIPPNAKIILEQKVAP